MAIVARVPLCFSILAFLLVPLAVHGSVRGFRRHLLLPGQPNDPVVSDVTEPTVATGPVDTTVNPAVGNTGSHQFTSVGDTGALDVTEANDVHADQPVTDNSLSGGVAVNPLNDAPVDTGTVSTDPITGVAGRRLHQQVGDASVPRGNLGLDGSSTTGTGVGTVDETDTGQGDTGGAAPHLKPHVVDASTTQAGQSVDGVEGGFSTDCVEAGGGHPCVIAGK